MKQKTFQGFTLLMISLIVIYLFHYYNKSSKVIIKQVRFSEPIETPMQIDRDRIEDKLVAPERRVDPRLNIRTRGVLPSYQKVGILFKDGVESLPLFGRPTYYGSDEYDYYVVDSSRNFNKIPLDDIKREIMDGDMVNVPVYNQDYKAMIYEPEEIRYNPYA
jgi:hypothetical protein